MALFAPLSAHAGFTVAGNQLLDGNGNPFILRGINHPHTWYTFRTPQAVVDMASVGANAVRVVLSNGQRWTRNDVADVANLIQSLKDNRLIAVLEVHDVTGWGEDPAAAPLTTAVDYWIDIKDALIGQEDYVIINIGNEPFGNNVPPSTWIDEHRNAIVRLRAAGLTHTLMVDAGNWGQDWQIIMLENADQVAAADINNNTMFSVHMYEVYDSEAQVEEYVTGFLGRYDFPLVVGEFGADHRGQPVDEDAILKVTNAYDVGYLGWSWSGNSGGAESLDIVFDFDVDRLSTWGDRLINGVDGIRATARIATVFDGAPTNRAPRAFDDSVEVKVDETVDIALSGSDVDGQVVDYAVTAAPANGTLAGIGANLTYTPNPGYVGTDSFEFMVTDDDGATSNVATVSINVVEVGSTDSQCTYTVTNEWGSGFVAEIRIENLGTQPIEGWQVSWSYAGDNRVGHAWNTNLSGSNPYDASNLDWNRVIQPGQAVVFGLQGSKGAGPAEVPVITGDICNATP